MLLLLPLPGALKGNKADRNGENSSLSLRPGERTAASFKVMRRADVSAVLEGKQRPDALRFLPPLPPQLVYWLEKQFLSPLLTLINKIRMLAHSQAIKKKKVVK